MRESIGGTWLISIVITFIALFAAFLAYAISYTKAFNAKNYIINLISCHYFFKKIEELIWVLLFLPFHLF